MSNIYIVLLSVFNMMISYKGIKLTYNRKSYLVFVWFVLFYYSLISLFVSVDDVEHYYGLISKYSIISYSIKFDFNLLIFSSLILMLLSEYLFGKRYEEKDALKYTLNNIFICELVFWISIISTFIKYRGMSYADVVNSEEGGGYSFVFFQLTSGILTLFILNKKTIKVLIAFILIFLMAIITNVRSLMFYPLFAVFAYFLDVVYNNNLSFGRFKIKLFYTGGVIFLIGILLTFNRTGTINMPEEELIRMAFGVLDSSSSLSYKMPLKLFDSFLNFGYGFFSPIKSLLEKTGISFLYKPPLSVPYLNASLLNDYNMNVLDQYVGVFHAPTTIFIDFRFSFGIFGCIAGFFVYTYFLIIERIIRSFKSVTLLLLPVFFWHIYMILRGATDYASMGISYTVFFAIILYPIVNRKFYFL